MDVDEFEVTLDESEVLLDRIRSLYEQYFQGLERLEPTIPRKELDRRIYQMRRNLPRNTALKFRFHQLVQRYTTYQSYWRRVTRQIEEGTYRRDVMRARRRRQDARDQRRGVQKPLEIDIDIEQMDIGDAEDEAAAALAEANAMFRDDEVTAALRAVPSSSDGGTKPAPTRPTSLSPFAIPSKAPAAAGAPPPGASQDKAIAINPREGVAARARTPSSSDVKTFGRPKPAQPPASARQSPPARPPVQANGRPTEARLRKVYDEYVAARKRNNERTDNLRYEKVKSSIEKMLPKLQQKHKGKNIDFEVVVRNGRVGLKPVPK